MKSGSILENIEILSMASEGKCVARVENKVIFVKGVAPGDVCDLKITKSKKKFSEAIPVAFRNTSTHRVDPFCSHFGTCGGCKWQHISYQFQLTSKQKLVEESFAHPVRIEIPEVLPIMESEKQTHYRNKLEYTFSNYRWITNEELESKEKLDRRGLGFHVPGRFDRVVNIQECFLQPEPSNGIRNALRDFALKENLSFYNFKTHSGFLRNLIIRNTTLNEVMLIVQFSEDNKNMIEKCMTFLKEKFPEVTSLQYVINQKKNETFFDQEVKLFHGKGFITEQFENYKYRIGPKSFFQTNSHQALRLYQKVREMASLSGKEIIYDLYCGTGTIGIFLSDKSKSVLSIDSIPEAIEDAKENALINNVNNIEFLSGDLKDFLSENLIERYGFPDVVICDPPRAGMHQKVIENLIKLSPEKIIYVSCNPATQARDIALLINYYEIISMQPMDMFPHTTHVENIALLHKRS